MQNHNSNNDFPSGCAKPTLYDRAELTFRATRAAGVCVTELRSLFDASVLHQ